MEPDSNEAALARRKIKIYDFKRPDKFSKDQIRTVAMMHETFARLGTTALSSMLRYLAHAHLASVDQLTYEEFIRSIPNPTTIAAIAMEPLKGSALLEIDPAITFAIIDRLFGGQGKSSNLNRELTDIEVSVMEGAVERLLGSLSEAWAILLDLRPRLVAIETNPQFAQIVPPHEMIILVSLEAVVGEARGMINLCLPYLTIEPIVHRLSAQYIFSSRLIAPEGPFASVASLPMAAEVCFEGERLSLSALSRLKRGTLIAMPRYGEGSAFLQAGGAPFLHLAAQRSRGARCASYAVTDPRVRRELEILGAAGRAAEEKKADALQDALRSISAEIAGSMKSVEGKIADLAHRQEDLADQLIFETPDKEVAPAGRKAGQKRPFGFLAISDCDVLSTFVAQEHPQLIALVLSYLEPGLAACVLARMPADLQVDVAERICSMDRTAPEVLRRVEQTLEKKLSTLSAEDHIAAGGIEAVVEILNVGSRGLEKGVVETLEKRNAGLAEEIKKRMFVFEDIVLLDRETVTLVLKEVAEEDLLLAMKAVADEKVRSYVWGCVPAGELERLKVRFDASGRARLTDVEKAQQRIVAVIRRMHEEGRIVVARPDELTG
jgi:flagellar motor switch protein FliM/flagellar motor switch protein FliG